MADLGNTAWSPTDASNNTSPPNGWPEAMLPSSVNNSARMMMGALKREWQQKNAVVTSAGSTTAFTVDYAVASSALYDGEIMVFIADRDCVAAATINKNSLGAKAAVKFTGDDWAAVADGDWLEGQVVTVAYDLSNTRWKLLSVSASWTDFILASMLTTRGDIITRGASAPQRLALGTSGQYLTSDGTDAKWGNLVLRSYLAGLGTNNNGTTPNSKIDVAAGVCADDTNAQMLSLSATTLDCGSTGANGLDSGSLANSTWYHLFVIGKTDGTTALLASTALSSPTYPSGYTLKRRIGSFKTDGSAHILGYLQSGDRFLWKVPRNDQSPATVNSTAANYTISVPTGLSVVALIRAIGFSVGSPSPAGRSFAIYSPLQNAETVSSQASPANLVVEAGVSGNAASGNYEIVTDTSAHIAAVGQADGQQLDITTDGWIDSRGKDS